MSTLNIFSSGWVQGSGLITQFVPNPWGTAQAPGSDVWIQCTMDAFHVNNTPS